MTVSQNSLVIFLKTLTLPSLFLKDVGRLFQIWSRIVRSPEIIKNKFSFDRLPGQHSLYLKDHDLMPILFLKMARL